MAIALVQDVLVEGFAVNDVVLDDPPIEGNLLILHATVRSEDNFGTLIGGWTEVESVAFGPFGGGVGGVFIHTVEAAESGVYDFGSLAADSCRLYMTEWSGVFGVDTSDTLPNLVARTTATITVAPTAGVEALFYSAFFSSNSPAPFTADVDFTEIDAGDMAGARPETIAQYMVEASTSGSYSATVTISDAFHEEFSAGILVVFSGEPIEPPPDPESGLFTEDGVELPDVMHWTITRGASPEITGGATIGAATFLLRNRDNQYDPENTGGFLYPDLRDGLGIWQGINADGHATGDDPRGLFAGRIKDITLIPSPGTDEPATVEIVCEDPLGWYGRTPIRLGLDEGRSQGDLRLAALQAAGEERHDLGHEITTIQLSGADGSLLSVLEEINKANGTRHFVKPADNFTDWYSYTTRNRQWRLDATTDATISSTQHDQMTGWRLSADTVTNQQKASTTPIVFTSADVQVWKLKKRSLRVTNRRPFDRWIQFDDFVRDPHLDVLYTGDNPTISMTTYGDRAHLQITNGTGDSTTFSRLSIEGAIARRQPDEAYIANDTTSQALPRGIRAGSEITSEYVGILESARGIAEHVVWRYSDPQLRPTLTVQNWYPYQFEIDLYDIISFTSTHLGVTARLFEVVGLTHDGDRASPTVTHHTTTYVLQECRVQADPGWFVANVSTANSTDILAY